MRVSPEVESAETPVGISQRPDWVALVLSGSPFVDPVALAATVFALAPSAEVVSPAEAAFAWALLAKVVSLAGAASA